jgi:adenosylhomocysteine nucleosidase
MGPAPFVRRRSLSLMKRIGIVAALPSELRPLIHHWPRTAHMATGRIGSIDAVATCAGMGAKAVTRACEVLFASGPLDALVSVGYAGSLSCGLSAPEACAAREVIDAGTGERFPTDLLPGQPPNQIKAQRLVTLNHVANPEEKRGLAETYQATLVDMEAATVARFARSKNLGFLCFKAITDGPNDNLPDFNRFTNASGQLRIPAFALWTLWHPQYWRVLSELEKNSRAAASLSEPPGQSAVK